MTHHLKIEQRGHSDQIFTLHNSRELKIGWVGSIIGKKREKARIDVIPKGYVDLQRLRLCLIGHSKRFETYAAVAKRKIYEACRVDLNGSNGGGPKIRLEISNTIRHEEDTVL